MSEVEKLYKNAEVQKQIPKVCSNNELYCKDCEAHIENAIPYCKNAEYPTFTAEKQLEIVKLILFSTWWLNLKRLQFAENFENSLAELVNDIWQNLPEEEKQQVKGILE